MQKIMKNTPISSVTVLVAVGAVIVGAWFLISRGVEEVYPPEQPGDTFDIPKRAPPDPEEQQSKAEGKALREKLNPIDKESILIGFYSQAEETLFGKAELCDKLTITGGTENTIQFSIALVDRGNLVNSKDADGRLVMNLDLSELDAVELEKITSSTEDNPVDLVLYAPEQKDTEAPLCYSFFEIREVT
ncbi:MAG: hypothetical protein GY722_00500 [bacterium]|nr:hypothetical protein [bacterium]